MGKIRNAQQDLLEKGEERISFNVYDSEGTFIKEEIQNVLFSVKQDLVPLNMDMIKEYERPNKTTEQIIKLFNLYYKNKNAHFLYGDTNYIIQPADSGTSSQVIYDTDEEVKALSGNRFFKSTDLDGNGADVLMIGMNQEFNRIAQGKNITVGFNYYIATADPADKFELNVKASLDETYAVVGDAKQYNFETKVWENFPSQSINQSRHKIETSTLNSWGKATVQINPYNSTTVDTDSYMTISINKPKNIPSGTNADFAAIYIDNFFVAETIDLTDSEITCRRKQFPANGVFTNKYQSNGHYLSNEAKNTDYFIGKFDGEFKRKRDNTSKSLEQIVTQEKANDYRKFLTRYEGTVKDVSGRFMAFHNKVWMDFGEVYQDECSCYIDSMSYDVKAAEYDISMHQPNQDDDIGSSYVVLFD
jgi:hypothetical protein